MSVVCFRIIKQKKGINFFRGGEDEEEVDCRKLNWGYLNHFHKESYSGFYISL